MITFAQKYEENTTNVTVTCDICTIKFSINRIAHDTSKLNMYINSISKKIKTQIITIDDLGSSSTLLTSFTSVQLLSIILFLERIGLSSFPD